MQPFLLLLLFVAILLNTTSQRARSYERLSVEQLCESIYCLPCKYCPNGGGDGIDALECQARNYCGSHLPARRYFEGSATPKVWSLVWSNGNSSVLLVAGLNHVFFLHDKSLVLVGGGSTPIMLEGVESVIAETKSLLRGLRALSECAT